MSDISASDVAALRSRTGVSILECKKALEEAGGDQEKAIELLRKRGEAQAVKKADREQTEGYIFSAEASGKVAIVLLHCETDFVSRNPDFQSFGQELADLAVNDGADAVKNDEGKISDAVNQLGENISLGDVQVIEGSTLGAYVHTNGKIGVVISLDGGSEDLARDVAMHAAAMGPEFVSPDEVPQERVDQEKEIWKEQLAKEGKPAEIMEQIMGGKEKKFREESALLKQAFVKDPEKSIEQLLGDASVASYTRLAI